MARQDKPALLALWAHETTTEHVSSWVVFQALDLADNDYLAALLSCRASPDQQHRNNYHDYLIHRTVARGDHDKTRLLLAAGVDLEARDGNGYTPLATLLNGFSERPAEWEARKKLLDDLLACGANAAAWVWNNRVSILHEAPLELDVLEKLVAAGADPAALINPDPGTSWVSAMRDDPQLLFRAPELRDAKQLRKFLAFVARLGQGPSTRDKEGGALVHAMVRHLQVPSGTPAAPDVFFSSVLEVLHATGHDLLAADNQGNTALHVWAAESSTALAWWAQALLSRPDVAALATVRNHAGQTPEQVLLARTDWLRTSPVPHALALLRQASLEHGLPPAPARLSAGASSVPAEAGSPPRRQRL